MVSETVTNGLIYDPRTGLHLRPKHPKRDEQCAATDRGYYCTVKAGHDRWHVAHGMKPDRSLHIWLT